MTAAATSLLVVLLAASVVGGVLWICRREIAVSRPVLAVRDAWRARTGVAYGRHAPGPGRTGIDRTGEWTGPVPTITPRRGR